MPPPSPPQRLALERRRSARARISLTPLIDVVFILLIFFMLASNLAEHRAIRLDAPATASPEAEGPPAVLLRIAADGALDLNGEPISEGGLAKAMARLTRREREPVVVIRPGAGVDLQRAVSVLDRVEAAGIANARLMRGER